MIKKCPKCQLEKSTLEFYKNGKNKKGFIVYSSYCKKCAKQYLKIWKLKNGIVKTPHGTPIENLIGRIFGKLEIVSYVGIKKCGDRNRHIWLCRCECGVQKEILERSLKKDNGTRSCGCISKATGKNSNAYKGHEELTGSYWNQLKYSAKKRNINFNITIEYAWGLFVEQKRKCAISGVDIYFAETRIKSLHGGNTASLDRINSNKEYLKGNVQWVHKDVNIMKQAYDQNYFISFCKKIANNN